MNKNTRKTRTLALTLALCLALVCFAPAVSADAFESEPTYEHMYYFSDYYDAERIFNQVFVDELEYVENFHLEQIDVSNIVNYLDNFSCTVEDDSLVVFELRNMLTDYGVRLKDIFEDMYSKNCRIMFINGMEEVRMLDWNMNLYDCPYTEFLDYVDIHINLDIFTVFVDTILEKAETDGQISNTTFILDGTLVYRDLLENFYFPDYINDWYWEANYGIVQCWFLDYYLLPYFYMRYAEIDEFMAKDNLGELLTEYGIKIICHTGGNNYYDLLNDIEISLYDRDFSDYIYNEQVFAIGTSWQDEYFVNEWLYSLRTYQETSYEFFPIYFYNENNFDLWISEDEYFRTASGTEYFMENIFPDIALAFASGDDLSVYDNWDGRCVVTHKPIYAGENGWLNMYMRVLPYCSEKRDWLEYFGH